MSGEIAALSPFDFNAGSCAQGERWSGPQAEVRFHFLAIKTNAGGNRTGLAGYPRSS